MAGTLPLKPTPPQAPAPGAHPAEHVTARPAPGLVAIADPARTLPLAGYLLRHGPALALVPDVPSYGAVSAAFGGMAVPLALEAETDEHRAAVLERAVTATENAGFDLVAAELVPDDRPRARLRALAGEATCVVAATRSPGAVRRLARAAGAPVLALPAGAAPAGGPAVVAADDAAVAIGPVARALATEHVTLVAAVEPVLDVSVLRAARHPAVAARLAAVMHERHAQALDDAWWRLDDAAAAAEEHGLVPDPIVVLPRSGALLAAARPREGIVVAVDRGGRCAPAILRRALRERRAVLLVPA